MAPRRESGRQHEAVMPFNPTQADPEWHARPVDPNMALRARFAAMDEESSAARLQSSFSASARRSSRIRCRRAHTPAACQSRNRRQHVMPEQPISGGSISQGVPEHRTKRMPASAARSSTRSRPPLGLAGLWGRRGSITAHGAWETRSLAMPNQRTHPVLLDELGAFVL